MCDVSFTADIVDNGFSNSLGFFVRSEMNHIESHLNLNAKQRPVLYSLRFENNYSFKIYFFFVAVFASGDAFENIQYNVTNSQCEHMHTAHNKHIHNTYQ